MRFIKRAKAAYISTCAAIAVIGLIHILFAVVGGFHHIAVLIQNGNRGGRQQTVDAVDTGAGSGGIGRQEACVVSAHGGFLNDIVLSF